MKTKDVLKRTEMDVAGMRAVSVVTARYDHGSRHMEYLHHTELHADDGAVIQAPTIYSRENALAAHYAIVSKWLDLGATNWEKEGELSGQDHS